MLTFTKTWQILRCFSFETQDNTHIIDKNCQSNTLAAFLCKPLWSTCTVCKYMVVYRPARGGFGLELMVKRSKVRDLMCLFLRIIIHWVCCDFWFALCFLSFFPLRACWVWRSVPVFVCLLRMTHTGPAARCSVFNLPGSRTFPFCFCTVSNT